jgi:hypothetical protein
MILAPPSPFVFALFDLLSQPSAIIWSPGHLRSHAEGDKLLTWLFEKFFIVIKTTWQYKLPISTQWPPFPQPALSIFPCRSTPNLASSVLNLDRRRPKSGSRKREDR